MISMSKLPGKSAALASLCCALLLSSPAHAKKPPFKIKRASEARINRLELTEAAARRIDIKLGSVARKAVPQTLTLGGRTMVRPGGAALISAPFAGIVQAPRSGLPLPGTRIRGGQTLLKLRPLVAPGRHLLVEAQRDLTQAQARAQTAKKIFDRAQKLLKDGAGDQSNVDRTNESLQLANAELAAAQKRLKQLERNPLGADVSLPVRAQDAGVVLNLLAAPGQAVAAAERLIEVANLSNLWVRVPIYVGRLRELAPKSPALIRPLGQPSAPPLSASPVDTPPSAQGAGAVVELFFALPAQDDRALSPGAQVSVQLSLQGSAQKKLVVPRTAVFYDAQGASWVYTAVGTRKYERRRVDIEAEVGALALLLRGPPQGAQVVTQGAMELFGAEFGAGK